VTVCLLGEFNALFDVAVTLQQGKDCQMVDIIVILLHKVKEFLFKDLNFGTHHFFLALNHVIFDAFTDVSSFESGNLRENELSDPCADDYALGRPLVFRLGLILGWLPLVYFLRRRLGFRHFLQLFQHSDQVVN